MYTKSKKGLPPEKIFPTVGLNSEIHLLRAQWGTKDFVAYQVAGEKSLVVLRLFYRAMRVACDGCQPWLDPKKHAS